MSLDQRLRDGLDRMSSGVEPDVRERFAAATHRAQRARRVRQIAGGVLGIAVVLASVVAAPELLDAVRHRSADGAPAVQGSVPFPIPGGSYEVRISRTDALRAGVPDSEIEGFAGHYVFTFAVDGSYVWEEATPNPFIKGGGGGTTSTAGDLITFPDWLRGGSGDRVTVRIVSTSPALRFDVVAASPPDALPVARALFMAEPWTPTA